MPVLTPAALTMWLCLAVAASSVVTNSRAAADPAVQLVNGTVIGTADEATPDVRQFLGIPYAKPPVGSLRFMPPEPADAFPGGELAAKVFPPSCMQYLTNNASVWTRENLGFNIDGLNHTSSHLSEDCLTLSVYAPSASGSNQSLPVVVFLHGGGFIWGGQGEPYLQPSDWVQRSQAHIVVIPNYRLNIFGYPNAAGLATTSQNVGLMDQRRAIEWVRDNIEAFGGDTSRITLWGQSAGGISAGYYSYAYFDDPIVSSFVMDSGTEFVDRTTNDSTHSFFSFVAAHFGCDTSNPSAELECMQSQDAKAIEDFIQERQDAGSSPVIKFTPIIDEKIVFSNWSDLAQQGRISTLPTVVGSNFDDDIPFVPYSPDGVNKTLAWEGTLQAMFCPSWKSATIRLAANPDASVYRYMYSGNWSNISPKPWLGAWHATELPMLFGTYGLYSAEWGASTDFETATSQAMQDEWVAFLRGAAPWTPYNASTDVVRQFGSQDSGEPAVDSEFGWIEAHDPVQRREGRASARSHLKAAGHVSRTAQQRKLVAEAVQQLDGIICSQQQLQETFTFPEPDWAANPFLQPPVEDRLACRSCRRAASGWFEVERPSSRQTAIAGTNAGTGGSSSSNSSSTDSNSTNSNTWQLMLAAYDTKLATEEEERRREADGPGGIDTDSTWVQEMGWARHLEGKDLVVLHDASLGPLLRDALARLRDTAARDKQQQLTRLGESFDREVARCTARLELVPHETLQWLASIDPGKPAGRPFGVKEHASSMDQYKGYWKRYLCYCVQTRQLGREEAAAQHGVRFSDAQWDRLEAVAQLLENVANNVGVVADMEEEDNNEAKKQAHALDRLVFLFCISSLKQKIAFDVYVNPLLHFAAVLGIDRPRQAWKQAKDYTGQLAGIMWCGRLLILEHVFEDQPEDPSEMDIEVAEQFKEEYRQWLADGSNSPFSTMIRWMSYGKGHRQKEGGTARIASSGAQCKPGREAKRLMDGLFFQRWAEAQASVDTSRIVDSMIYKGPERSFTTGSKNDWLRPGYRRIAELALKTGRLWDAQKGQ
ncbi:Uu.00g135040.m01.CDS01 [Anthostomella pinea]|uniref:Uu.00g135040.m01.CDS01 n=1 Tax=Anthostomella pinea TaxID=933095 RepID=A0AAI8YKW5_9PEZI|nr:Uu.00g135040.m01.CDS01 [Anthostomella pinea]